MSRGADVVAAGAVVARRGGREVLLVHRPKYDDWSFPKGKQDPGEHITATAVREVVEETGLRIHLGRALPPQYYEIRTGRSKVVNYWVARCDPHAEQPRFAPNSEVDQALWLPVAEAARRLSYLDDCEILDAFRERPKRTTALVVLRHAGAVKRGDWKGKDPERPLTRTGRAQASALAPILDAFGVREVVSSSSLRCRETVEPFAALNHLQPDLLEVLSEESADPESIAAVVHELVSSRVGAVLCSHRPVLPMVLEQMGASEEPLAPGELVIFHHRQGRIIATERHQPV